MRINLLDPAFYQPERQLLDLHDQKLTDEDIPEIKLFLEQHPEITQLNLKHNMIGDTGAVILAEATKLTALDLRNNEIGDRGAIAMSFNGFLQRLDVSHNPIGSDGCRALKYNANFKKLYLPATRKRKSLAALNMNSLHLSLRREAERLEENARFALDTFSHEEYENQLIQAVGLQILIKANLFNPASKARETPEMALYMLGCTYFNHLKSEEFTIPDELIKYLSSRVMIDSDAKNNYLISVNADRSVNQSVLQQVENSESGLGYSIGGRLMSTMLNSYAPEIIRSALVDIDGEKFFNLDATNALDALRNERKPRQNADTHSVITGPVSQKSDHMFDLANTVKIIVNHLQDETIQVSSKHIFALREVAGQITYVLGSNQYENDINAIIAAIIERNTSQANRVQTKAFAGFRTYANACTHSGFFSGAVEKENAEEEESEEAVCDENKIAKLLKVVDAKKPSYSIFKILVGQLKLSDAELREVRNRANNKKGFDDLCLQLKEEQDDSVEKLPKKRCK